MTKEFKSKVREASKKYALYAMDEATSKMTKTGWYCFKYEMLEDALTHIMANEIEDELDPYSTIVDFMDKEDANMFWQLYEEEDSFMETIMDMFWHHVMRELPKWKKGITKIYMDMTTMVEKEIAKNGTHRYMMES